MLYELKDVLRQYNRLLPECINAFPEQFSRDFNKIQDLCVPIEQSLTFYLTNNGSEWLDSFLSGGLSFSQFRNLSLARIHHVKDLLVCCITSFDILQKELRDEESSINQDKEEHDEEQISTENGKSMDNLKMNMRKCENALIDLKDILKVRV
jgi:hypothetical protein